MDNVIELIKKISDKSIALSVDNNQIAVHGPKSEIYSPEVKAIQQSSDAIVALVKTFPMSPLAKELMRNTLTDKLQTYAFELAIDGQFTPEQIQVAWARVVAHFPLLRATVAADKESFIVADNAVTLPVDSTSLTEFSAQAWQTSNALSRALLLSDKNSYQLVVSLHVLIADGLAAATIAQALHQALNAPTSLKGESLQYIQYLAETSEISADAADYYSDTLVREPHRLSLFPTTEKSAASDELLATTTLSLPTKLTKALTELCKKEALSLAALFTGATQLLLSRYSEQAPLRYGIVSDGSLVQGLAIALQAEPTELVPAYLKRTTNLIAKTKLSTRRSIILGR